MIHLVLLFGLMVLCGVVGYIAGQMIGTVPIEEKLKRVQRDYDEVVGLWATDRPNLIKSPRLKSLFYRIGYPEERL